MFKKILAISALFATISFAFTGEEAQNPKIAVQEVIQLFKTQIKTPIIKTIIKIPYNINYSVYLKNKSYFVSEYKIRIIYKTAKMNSFYTDEKDYIIRMIVNPEKDKVIKEEIYSLTKEKINNN